MRWRGAWAAAGIAGWLALPAVAGEGESPAAQAGHNLYSEHCEVCHGIRGGGDGPLASELRVRPAALTRIAQRRSGVFPDVEVREIIDASYASDVRDKVEALVIYLKSIQKPSPTAPTREKKD